MKKLYFIYILLIIFVLCACIIDKTLCEYVSMFVGGAITGLVFGVLSYPLVRSHTDYLIQRNNIVFLHLISGILIHIVAILFGEGSVYNIISFVGMDFSLLVIGGSIFGLMMSFGTVLDYAFYFTGVNFWLMLFGACIGFIMTIAWYSALTGIVFIIGSIAFRIGISIFLHKFTNEIEEIDITYLVFFTLLTAFLLIPLTAFLSK